MPPKGDGSVMTADMGSNYEYQYFVSLQENKIIHISKNDTWHLAFETTQDGYKILLNGGTGMAAMKIQKSDFKNVNSNDTIGLSRNWVVDRMSGDIDSSAIGDWKKEEAVYLIRLNPEGTKIRKLKITYVDAFQYIIEIGDINSTQATQFTLVKKASQNYTYFSFDFLTTVDNVEPQNKNDWDIQITKYSYVFYEQNPPLPYIVVGVLLNPTNTLAYKDSLTDFNNINESFVSNLSFQKNPQIIGFDWKTYDIDKNIYTIDRRYNYIVKNTNNNAIVKLRFLDFYSSTGLKGSPKFELKRVK